jgi:serine/threonine protein kinase
VRTPGYDLELPMYPPPPGPAAGHSAPPVTAVGGGPVHESIEFVGRYELVRRLGSGGMAEVHLARATGLEGFEKLLVLKRILPHLSADPHFIKMFLAEARLAAVLDHPNIVQVFDLGFDDGDYFFTMEFVYGENLQAIQRAARHARQRLPFEMAVAIGIGTATGLHYAHERVGWDGHPLGIVHRDVSPTNVMVTYDGCVKVADFGIAKVTNRTDVTRAGMRKGKVPYMSPEQCRAEKLDRRSDLFSLGIVLYECTTGRRLFDGDNEFGVMNRIVNGDIEAPSNVRPGFPKELERIILRALAVDKQRRYVDARELGLDLERFARERKLDVSAGALGHWMHQVFHPRPYPWGALVGDPATSAAPPSLTTHADAMGSSVGGSSPGIPQSSPEVTGADVSSWVPPPSQPGYPSASHLAGSVPSIQQARREGQLRGLAIGLSSVAAAAVVAVGGLFAYNSLSATEAMDPASPAADAAIVESEDGSADEPIPGEPRTVGSAEPEPAAPASAAEADDEAEPEVDDEPVVVVDDEPARPSRTATSTKKSSSAKDRPRATRTVDKDDPDTKPDKSPPSNDGGKTKPTLDTFLPQ